MKYLRWQSIQNKLPPILVWGATMIDFGYQAPYVRTIHPIDNSPEDVYLFTTVGTAFHDYKPTGYDEDGSKVQLLYFYNSGENHARIDLSFDPDVLYAEAYQWLEPGESAVFMCWRDDLLPQHLGARIGRAIGSGITAVRSFSMVSRVIADDQRAQPVTFDDTMNVAVVNPTLEVTPAGGSLDVNITNSELDVNITNSELDTKVVNEVTCLCDLRAASADAEVSIRNKDDAIPLVVSVDSVEPLNVTVANETIGVNIASQSQIVAVKHHS